MGVIPEDWRLEKFVDVTDLITCGLAATPTYVSNLTGYPFLSSTNVKNGRVIWSNFKHIASDLHRRLYKNNPPLKGDILYSRVGTIGEAAVIEESIEFSIYVSLTLIKPKSLINHYYLMHLLNSEPYKQRAYDQVYLGGGVGNLNVDVVRSYPIVFPPNISEQEAIAEALSDADALIEGLEQLITKKRQLKQGAMQELLNPESDWSNYRIGDLLRVAHGKSQHDVTDPNGEYPILATGGQIGWAKHYLYNKPSVLIGRKGTIDRPQYMDEPFWTVDTLFYSEVYQPNNAKYLFYQFCLIDWKQYNEASGVPSLNARTIESIELKAPSPEKQTNIATILSDMDAEIRGLEQKLAKARLVKQGMMQELLTGKTRLV
ncbi:MAG: restriction endonuclease subunit S [Deinococcota bacterium]